MQEFDVTNPFYRTAAHGPVSYTIKFILLNKPYVNHDVKL